MTPLTGFMTFLKYILDLPSVPYHCMFLGKQRSYCGAFPLELYLPGAFDQNDYVYEVYNFLWRISVSALRQLKEHAYSSLRLLQSPAYESNIATSSFKSVFLEKYRFVHNYDLIFHISCADRITVRRHTHEIPSDVAESTLLRLDNLTSWQYTSEIVQFLLQESLGNRVTKVHIYSQPHSLLFGYL